MIVKTFNSKTELGSAAAAHAAASINRAVDLYQKARIIAATGASQFEFLEALTAFTEVSWEQVEMFHLDEYVGLSADHPASFRKYLRERLIDKVGLKNYHLLNGEVDPLATIAESGEKISAAPVDVAFVGIGENGHLAFNDPPADFETTDPYLLVNLDEKCRQQQVGEGWFASLAEVPAQAISMSIKQILKAREIICIVPDARKAIAVQTCLEGPISPLAPASILRGHPAVTVYLDQHSAALLRPGTITADAKE